MLDDGFDELIAEIIEQDDITPEQRRVQLETCKVRLLSEGFLPMNDEFDSTVNCSMEVVEQNPRKFIIEECIPACLELWKKNIYTFMVSDHDDKECCWIEVVLDTLSDENKLIFIQLEGEDIIKRSYHGDCISFGVKGVGAKAQVKLLELAKQFQMQDVPYGQAYITLHEYLIRCGCYDEVENPDYVPMTEPWKMDLSEELADYFIKYDEWKDSDRSKKTHRVFNPSKVTKPLEKYFTGTGVVYDGDKVYLSDYHYKKHMNYINSLTSVQSEKPNFKK